MPQQAGGTSAGGGRSTIVKLTKAKQELEKAVQALEKQHKFNVVFYANVNRTKKWKKGLVPANSRNKKALVSLLILRPMYLLILLHQRRARLRVLLALKSLRFLLALLRGIEITGSGRRRRRRSPSSRALLRRASLLALLLRLRFLLARLRGIQITGRGGRRRRRRRPSNRALTSSTSLAATIGGGARRTTSGSLG